MSDVAIGAFVRFVRQDPLAAARALKGALTDETYCALFEALTRVEGWEVSSVETEADDSPEASEDALRYERKTVTYDRWVPRPGVKRDGPCPYCDDTGVVKIGRGWDAAPCLCCEVAT